MRKTASARLSIKSWDEKPYSEGPSRRGSSNAYGSSAIRERRCAYLRQPHDHPQTREACHGLAARANVTITPITRTDS